MAPEQAMGKTVDKRADIWAFGVVLYELVTGERRFDGEDVADTLAQVLTKEIDFNRVPAQARPLLEESLQRDPRQRLRDIGDAGRLIGKAPTQVREPSRTAWLPWAAAGLMALVAGVLGFMWSRSAQVPDRPLMRLSVDLGPTSVADTELTAVLSPDGMRMAHFVKQASDRPSVLAVRQLDQPIEAMTVLSGTEDAWLPFFSPDGGLGTSKTSTSC
jgi:serine/threonine-protein kinase